MFQTRDEVRQTYLKVWQKMHRRDWLEPMEAMIAEVIELHPEYHSQFDAADEIGQREYLPEGGQTNPFLHMGMHIALREQASADRPPGVKAIHQTIVLKHGQHQAEHAMMECLGEALWQAERDQRPPDESNYLSCLKKL